MLEVIRSFLHIRTFKRLKEILSEPTTIDKIATEDYQNTDTNIKEVSDKPLFMFLTDGRPQLYLMPSIGGLGDYRVYYRVGKAESHTANLLTLELNLSANRGAICTMPELQDNFDTSTVSLYYHFECNRRDLSSTDRLLSLLEPVQNEAAYKLSLQCQRVSNFISNEQAIKEEFNPPNDEDYE